MTILLPLSCLASITVSAIAATADMPSGDNNYSNLTSTILDNTSSNHSNVTMTDAGPNNSSDAIEFPFNRWAVAVDRPEHVVGPIVFGLIFLVGLVGNGTLIVSVIANKVMRNVPNILIVSLSLGDFLLILVSVPFTSVIYTLTSWPFGDLMCKLNEYFQTLSLGVSVFTLTALSADRYVAIVDPMAKLAGRTQRTTVGIAVGIWLLSALLAIPDLIFWYLVSTNSPQPNALIKFCGLPSDEEHPGYGAIYVSVRFVVFFCLPVLTISFFYIMMARILIRSSESVPTESKAGAANHHRQIAARRKVARVVLSFVVIFIICWLPRHVYLIWYYVIDEEYTFPWHVFKIISFCLTYLNSCVNPFALYFLSGQFRKCFNRYLFCCCRRVRYSSLEPNSTMHNLHSTTRRTSPTNMSMVHSQSMC